MAVGGSQSVRGVHIRQHVFLADMEHTGQHACHLFFAGLPVSGDGHFDFERRIFGDGDVTMDSRCDSHPLCASQFQHALYVFAEERCFDGHFVRQVRLDDACHPFEYPAEFQVWTGIFAQVDDAHGFHDRLVSGHTQHAISHEVRARVYAQDYLFAVWLVRHESVFFDDFH